MPFFRLRFMLPRHQRLSRPRIEYIFKKGRKIVRNPFILKFLPTSRPVSRFCVIVSAKVAPKAVTRNLVRRRIHEVLRLHGDLLKESYDVIMIPSAGIIQNSYQDIEKNILSILPVLSLSKGPHSFPKKNTLLPKRLSGPTQ